MEEGEVVGALPGRGMHVRALACAPEQAVAAGDRAPVGKEHGGDAAPDGRLAQAPLANQMVDIALGTS